jgi:hypothetical protein
MMRLILAPNSMEESKKNFSNLKNTKWGENTPKLIEKEK